MKTKKNSALKNLKTPVISDSFLWAAPPISGADGYKRKNSMKTGKNPVSKSLKTAVILVFLLWLALPVFGQPGGTGGKYNWNTETNRLSAVVDVIVEFFRSPLMKGICTIALGGLGIGVLMNRGEPGMVKKFIPWIIGVTILLGLSGLADLIFKSGD